MRHTMLGLLLFVAACSSAVRVAHHALGGSRLRLERRRLPKIAGPMSK